MFLQWSLKVFEISLGVFFRVEWEPTLYSVVGNMAATTKQLQCKMLNLRLSSVTRTCY